MSDSSDLARRFLDRRLISPDELLAAPSAPPGAARSIGGYEIVGELGRGGSAIVYRGRAPDGRSVAVKVLERRPLRTAEALARFQRESRLHHGLSEVDGFVPLLGSGLNGDAPYLVMPLVPGGTLRERLARFGPLGETETLALGRKLATALGRAHARGIVHRDLKPENVLFTDAGEPLIADLGLAKHWSHDAPGASQSVALSKTGELRGTLGYMPPEQMLSAKDATPAADVFALGAILRECLLGASLAPGFMPVEIAARLLDGPVAPIRTLWAAATEPLASVIDRALSSAPEARFPHAAAMARALEGEPPPATRRSAGRALALVVAGAGLAVALLELARARPIASDEARAPAASTAPMASNRAALAAEACRHLERARRLRRAGDAAAALQASGRAVDSGDSLAAARLERGELRLATHDFAGAESDARRALELEPGSAAGHVLRAEARIRVASLEAALEDARSSVALDARCVSGHVVLAEIERRLGHRDEAIAAASSAIALDPRCARALAVRVWAAATDDRSLASRILASSDESPADRKRLAELDPVLSHEVSRSKETPRDELEALLRAHPDAAALWGEAAMRAAQEGALDRALEAARRAIELDPAVPDAWRACAWVELARGALRESVADASRALELDRGAPAYRLRGAARLLLAAPDEREAGEADLDAGIAERWPNLEELALDFLEHGETKGALALADAQLRRDSDGPSALDFRVRVLAAQGDLVRALEAATRAIELSATDARLAERALLLAYAGDLEAARADLARTKRTDGSAARVTYLLDAFGIEALRTADDVDAARHEAERLAPAGSHADAALVHTSLARLALDREEHAVAIVHATVAIVAAPANAAAFAVRGFARATDDPTRARADLERALELAPSGPLAPELRRALGR